MRARTLRLKSVSPPAAIEGGKVLIEGSGFDPEESANTLVMFGNAAGRVSLYASSRLIVEVPEDTAAAGPIVVSIKNKNSNALDFEVAKKLLGDINPVDSPLFDPDGNLYVTFSGKRGEMAPVSVYKIPLDGEARPHVTNIPNATSLALDGEGNLYVSSRFEGSIYKATPKADVTLFAKDLGTPTGLAFGPDGHLYVGDRAGRILKLNAAGEATVFAEIPESVVAFHMSFDNQGNLLVSNPGLSSYNNILRVDPEGKATPLQFAFGRPQGMAVDSDGNIYVCEAKAGESNVVRISPTGETTNIVSGAILVGVALDGHGNMAVTTQTAVYKLPLPTVALP